MAAAQTTSPNRSVSMLVSQFHARAPAAAVSTRGRETSRHDVVIVGPGRTDLSLSTASAMGLGAAALHKTANSAMQHCRRIAPRCNNTFLPAVTPGKSPAAERSPSYGLPSRSHSRLRGVAGCCRARRVFRTPSRVEFGGPLGLMAARMRAPGDPLSVAGRGGVAAGPAAGQLGFGSARGRHRRAHQALVRFQISGSGAKGARYIVTRWDFRSQRLDRPGPS